MFEISNRGMTEFLELKNLGIIDHTCVYDFSFENRYLIYHHKISGMYEYIAYDITTGRGSTVCTKKEPLKKAQFHSMIGDILYSIKYTGDRRHVKTYTIKPEEFIEIVFRKIMPAYGYAVREEQIRMARTMYEGLTHKTVSNMIGHSSVATTLDIYSHITDEMLKNASRVIDRGIGKEINRPENEIEMAMKQEVTPPTQTDFTAYKGKIRKSGTGGIYKLNDHLYEGRYTPTNAYGKRESCNVYAQS